MNAFAIERENSIKSSITTTVIVICMALILWLCRINIEIPARFTEATNVEMILEPPAGGSENQNNAKKAFVPIEASDITASQRHEETLDKEAVKQNTVPENTIDKPVDHSIEDMLRNKEKARLEKEGSKSGNNQKNMGNSSGNDNTNAQSSSEGIDKTKLGVSSTIIGRSFIGGSTSTDCHEAGKVVLEIQVLPNGDIVYVDIDPASNGSDCLVKAAKEILKNSSFNVSTKPVSNGTITFIFKLN